MDSLLDMHIHQNIDMRMYAILDFVSKHLAYTYAFQAIRSE